MSVVFCLLPSLLKPMVKEAFPEVTFLKVDELDESMHGTKTRKKREKKSTKQDDNSTMQESTSEH